VPTTDLSGFQPNVEAISTYEPDLVVISDDTAGLKAALEDLGAEVVVQPAATTLDDSYAQIEELGEATGHEDEATEVVDDIRAGIDEVVDEVRPDTEGLTYYHELDTTLFSASSNTFIGTVYGLLGLENIADEADDGSGYPQLSAEYIVQADPDIVFLADGECCGQTAETVAERPGWANLAAVREGRVIELDEDIASRWGPRVVDFLETVAEELEGV
jgi:iron complex transport system substrate-binding protein